MTSSKSLEYQERLAQGGMMIASGQAHGGAYGFDEIAPVPGSLISDPENFRDVSPSNSVITSWKFRSSQAPWTVASM